ncbi:MAG: alpha/beta fold hydrolase [Anaerolineae bacterium]|nr:alpha/beta fold hydrolase [Anaerolineae bacterium]
MKKSILIITLFLLALSLTPALAQVPEGEEYVVQAGDWLSKIADKYYGSSQTFQVIIDATNAKAAEDDSFAVIDNPDVVVPGQKLWIPAVGEGQPDGTGPSEAAPTAPAADFGEAWESVSCDTFDVAPEIAPMADCGYVTVPENRATGSDSSIKLAVARVRTESANPGAPVFLAVGGPGGDGFGRAYALPVLVPLAPVLADHDFIFFSQRGTKHAQPRLNCQGFNDAPVETAKNGWSSEERHNHEIAAMQSCIDEAEAQGIDLSAYNSVENAADVDSIRQALGYDKIVLYGQSYGTQLAQFVMRNHPEILESVILDGILAATATKEADYFDKRDSWLRVFAACAADETCNAAYPDPEGVLAELYAALEANPEQIEVILDHEPTTFIVDGSLALEALFTYLPPHKYGVVPAAIYQMREGDWSLLSASLPNITISTDKLMHFAMICSDDPNTSMADIKTEGWAEMYIDGVYGEDGDYVDLCALFNNLPQLPDSSDELVVSDIPTLLLQGGLDPVTPVANGNNVETGLSHSYNIVFPDGGHVVGTLSACGTAIMAAFINDPSTQPDTSCIPQTYTFSVPRQVTATSADGTASLSMQLPAGFQDTANGYSSPPVIITLLALPSQTPEEAIMSLMSKIGLPENEIVDGDPVAGQPTKRYQAEDVPLQGFEFGIDIIAFADDAGTYVIFVQNQEPDYVESYRQEQLPALLESVTVGE